MYKIHLNADELTLLLLFFTGFHNKFKINLFSRGFGIMQSFPKFTFLYTNRCVCINGEAIYSSVCCCFLLSLSFRQHDYNFLYQLPNLSVARAYFTVLKSFLFNRVFVGNTKLSTTSASNFSHLLLLKSLSTI